MFKGQVGHKNLVVAYTAILVIVLSSATIASSLPDTLKFGNQVYVKSLERLYHNRAKLILINESEQPNYVMAELFNQHVSFLNQQGRVVRTDTLPTPPYFIASKTGRWLYLWGKKDAGNAYNRIYGSDGQLLFNKSSAFSGTEPPFGIPIEDALLFLKDDWSGKDLQLIDNEEQIVASVQPMGKDHEGKILYASDLRGDNIFIATASADSTAFICYDSRLIELSRAGLPLNEVTSLASSFDGRFALLRFSESGDARILVIMSNGGKKLFELDNAKICKISKDGNYLGVTDFEGGISLISTINWETILHIDSASVTGNDKTGTWRSVNFSDDGRFMIILGESQMTLIDIQNKSWNFIGFLNSFSEAKLINDSSGLIITGEMGWMLYRQNR
jgi:hypothetical protein